MTAQAMQPRPEITLAELRARAFQVLSASHLPDPRGASEYLLAQIAPDERDDVLLLLIDEFLIQVNSYYRDRIAKDAVTIGSDRFRSLRDVSEALRIRLMNRIKGVAFTFLADATIEDLEKARDFHIAMVEGNQVRADECDRLIAEMKRRDVNRVGDLPAGILATVLNV